MTRQFEVSAQFAQFLRQRCLTSEKIWAEILTGNRRAAFYQLLDRSVEEWVSTDSAMSIAASVRGNLAPTISAALRTVRAWQMFARERLPFDEGIRARKRLTSE